MCNNDNNKKAETTDTISNDSLIKRGEYLVNAIGCDHCHSPKNFGPNGPEVDISKRFSGYPSSRPLLPFDTTVIKKGILLFGADLTLFGGPWGISFAANISGDATGIGTWTEDQFKRAFTEGKFLGQENGRMLLPPMPWQSFSNFNEIDVKAIYSYLKSTKPVNNVVPAPIAFNEIK